MNQSLFIWGASYSTFTRSVKLYCQEKGLNYQSDFNQPMLARSPRHYRINPFTKMPILQHGDFFLTETTAICRYLDKVFEHNSLQPTSIRDAALLDQWANYLTIYIDDILIRRYLLEFNFPKGENGQVRQEVVTENREAVLKILQLLNQQLADKPFLIAGHYTMADALLTPMLDYLARLPHGSTLLADYIHLKVYLQAMRQRPSGQIVLT